MLTYGQLSGTLSTIADHVFGSPDIIQGHKADMKPGNCRAYRVTGTVPYL